MALDNSYLFNPNKIFVAIQMKLSCHLSAPAVGAFVNLTQLGVCIVCMCIKYLHKVYAIRLWYLPWQYTQLMLFLFFKVKLAFDSCIPFLLRWNNCIKYLNYVAPHLKNIGGNIGCQMQHFLSRNSHTNVVLQKLSRIFHLLLYL